MKLTKSSIYLIIVNLIPVIGVGFFGWNLYEIMLSYWVENIVIGIYAVLKIAMAKGVYNDPLATASQNKTNNSKFFIIPIFFVHYGIFTLGHGLFIYGLFGPNNPFGTPGTLSIWPLLISFGSFLVSHGLSFKENYIGKKENLKVSSMDMMFAPYGRVIVMHLAVMGSALVLAPFGSNIISRMLVIAIKTGLDYVHHQIQHGKLIVIRKPTPEEYKDETFFPPHR